MAETIELTTAHEFQVHGERGWFTFLKHVTEDGKADYIDAYGGTDMRRRFRSFRPDAVRKVRPIADRGATDLRTVTGCLWAALAFGCIFAELGSRWFIVPAAVFGVAALWSLNNPRRRAAR